MNYVENKFLPEKNFCTIQSSFCSCMATTTMVDIPYNDIFSSNRTIMRLAIGRFVGVEDKDIAAQMTASNQKICKQN